VADVSQIIQDAATANGVDPAVLARIAQVESGSDPNAAASGSSAKGLFQVTTPTWQANGGGDDPLDPVQNATVGARLTKKNIDGLTAAGLEPSPSNIYLAHFSGLGGAKSILGADPSTPAGSILGDAAVKANPFLANMSAGDLQAWADRKMAGGSTPSAPRPTTGILNTASAAAPTGKPGMLNGGTPDTPDEPDLTNVLAKALPPVEQQQVAALPPIRFVAPKGYDRAKFLAALTARKTA
jgi:hypothetical protein